MTGRRAAGMKKFIRMIAAGIFAGFLLCGSSMTSQAAQQGWAQENGRWIYLNADGSRAYSTFKQSGSEWFYLDDSGYLAVSRLIEYNGNYYYLDDSGVMKKNTWAELENAENDEQFPKTVWYYLQASGKACMDGKKDINGQTYIFDDQGRMLYGWIIPEDDGTYTMADKSEDSVEWAEAVYYCGAEDDGAMVKGQWRKLRVYDSSPSGKRQGSEFCDYWFYFNTNGKKYRNEDDEKTYVQKSINGVKYAFADDGHMLSEWVDDDGDTSEVKYFGDPSSGARMNKGWFKVVPSEGLDSRNSENGSNEAQWYYADSSGNLYKNAVKTINDKRYLFDETGAARTGLYYLVYSDGEIREIHEIEYGENSSSGAQPLDEYTKLDSEYIPDESAGKTGLYYFAPPADSDASMQTGAVSIVSNTETLSFRFETSGSRKGAGVNGREGDSYYINGRKLTADAENRFDIYECTFASNGKVETLGQLCSAQDVITGSTDADYCVISATGTIIKTGTKKNGDDYRLTMKGYELIKISVSGSDKEVLWEKATQ